jgi:hypothetical protein
MSSAYDKFAKAERLELVCAELYRLLARQFSHDPAANALFLRLEGEEIQHTLRVQKLQAMYSNDSLLRTAEIDLEDAAIDGLLEDARILKGLLSSDNSSIGFAEAKSFMADLEEKFAIAHAEHMAKSSDPAVRQMFETLSQQDYAHMSLLRRA